MAERTPGERLQPSLLDRLTDKEPNKKAESREQRVMSMRALRQSVLRDLGYLLNTTNLFSVVELPRLPHLENSVINYGILNIPGVLLTSINTGNLERGIRQAIWDYEPRLKRESVTVKALPTEDNVNKIVLVIEADMWAQPYHERLYLRAELDIDLTSVKIMDLSGIH